MCLQRKTLKRDKEGMGNMTDQRGSVKERCGKMGRVPRKGEKDLLFYKHLITSKNSVSYAPKNHFDSSAWANTKMSILWFLSF